MLGAHFSLDTLCDHKESGFPSWKEAPAALSGINLLLVASEKWGEKWKVLLLLSLELVAVTSD